MGTDRPGRTLTVSATVVLDQTWPAVPETVPVARRTVLHHLAAAEVGDPPLNDIGLAISEGVTNVVHHAYLDQDPGDVCVRVEMGDQEIELTIEDHGRGMAPRPDSPGLGLGMPLIATVADRFDVRSRSRGGTRLCVWFSKNPGDATLPA